MNKVLIGLTILCVTGFTACSHKNPVQSGPEVSVPTDAQESDVQTSMPTPSDEQAVITGVLLQGTSELKPVVNAILYLADIINSSDGIKAAASFDRQSSPNTQTDKNGRFVFTEVEPGEYALVLDRIYNSFLLQDPDGGDFLFTAEAGEVLDLGDLDYLSLPGTTP
jgi:hypothetical protein